ncbi:hypothetical protein P378_05130 [Desulforamulus profundi]|uniref:Uncharacterized protein n=1 Tax=Desulforamulus profundi TaxID=1383067 RepID=A0A2C6M9Y5_9FIRM|nr:hypothetical protein [Desulforamulus profundi]PHJ39157.1 hypothetical protein P378_05130 [Desulforamulus profundi]
MKNMIDFIKDERGDFIQNGLWIIIVVLLVAGASLAFAGSLKTKFNGIKGSVDNVQVPQI